MSLIIVKKTKDLFKARGLKTSDAAIKTLNKEFEKICQQAADTVVSNKLKTVKSAHIPKISASSGEGL